MASSLLIGSPPEALKVVEMDPLSDARWEEFVIAHPDGSIFHHPAWLQALIDQSNRKPICLACLNAGGQVRALLPLLETPGFWFNLGPPSVRRRMSSLPRTPIAGPLSADPEATLALVKAALERVCENPGMTLELKMPSNELDGMIEGLVGVPWKENYVLELPDNPEKLQFGNSVTRHRIKSAVKKAKNLGVQVRAAESEQDLREWYELYLSTMRWHISLPRPYRFIQALWELLRPRQLMRLLLAEQYRDGQRNLLSGYLLLMAGKTVHCYLNGRRKEDLGLHPNDILQWQAIHDSCKEGFRRYNFLEVQEGQQGLAQFKVKWGARPVRSYRYYYPATRELGDRDPGAEGSIQRAATNLWRRVPLRVTELMAARVHKYL